MKQTKLIISLFLVSCFFASCHNNDGPSRDDIKKMKETAEEWKPYLSDNYQEGDSVYFLRTDLATQETQVEGFVVEASLFFERGYEQEDDLLSYKDEENASFSYVIEGYTDAVKLSSTQTRMGIELEVDYNEDNKSIYENCGLCIIYNRNFYSCYEVRHMTIDEDYITVTSCSDKCTMQRNVGIISFSNDQYSWELIEKN